MDRWCIPLTVCAVALCVLFPSVKAKLKGDECEVCISFLKKFEQSLSENYNDLTDVAVLEEQLISACKKAKDKDERFCYYIGASDTSATKIVKQVTRPLSYGKPVEKICEELKKTDSQICELRYDKPIDLTTIDLKTLKVKQLRNILKGWGESCKGCAEKRDFIDKINQIKHLHTEL